MRRSSKFSAFDIEELQTEYEKRSLAGIITDSPDLAKIFARVLVNNPLFETIASNETLRKQLDLAISVSQIEETFIKIEPSNIDYDIWVIRNICLYSNNGKNNLRIVKFLVTNFNLNINSAIQIITSKINRVFSKNDLLEILNRIPFHISWRASRSWIKLNHEYDEEMLALFQNVETLEL